MARIIIRQCKQQKNYNKWNNDAKTKGKKKDAEIKRETASVCALTRVSVRREQQQEEEEGAEEEEAVEQE